MTEVVSKAVDVAHTTGHSSDDGASLQRENSSVHPPVNRHDSSLSLSATKDKVTFDEEVVTYDDEEGGDGRFVSHRRTPSGERSLSKFKPFKKHDAPISKELSERARSAPLVKKFALPSTETLINDYSAALLKHILIHGRMYLSQNYICFESKIFGIKTMEVIPFKDVTFMTKRSKTLKFAHGIEVTTSSQTYYFASFVSREKAFGMLTKIWRQHVPKSDLNPDDDDYDDDDDSNTGTQDYESDDSTLKKKDKKTAKEHADGPFGKLGRSVECPPENTDEREKGLRRFSSPLLSRVLPNGSSKHSSNLSSSTTNIEHHDTESAPVTPTAASSISPPFAAPTVPSVSAPTTPIPSPHESEDEDDGMYDEGDGFLNESQFQQVLEKPFPVNVKTFFKVFFSDDSTFTKTYHDSRGDKDLVVKKWSNSPQFGNIRDVLFLSPVKVPLGPSHTRLTETQRYHLTKNRLLIDTISMMLDIPYGDSFRIEGKWDVTLTGPESCKLVVNIGVHFMKKTWFKGKIETQTIKETKESFQQWASLAPSEIAKYKANLAAATAAASTAPPNPAVSLSPNVSQDVPVTKSSTTSSTASSPPSSLASSQVDDLSLSSSSSAQSVSFTPTISLEGASKSSIEGGKFTMITKVFTSIPNPVPGFSVSSIIIVVMLGLLFLHMYTRIAYLEGRVDTLESILQPMVTKALQGDLGE